MIHAMDCILMCEAGIGREIRVHKVNDNLCLVGTVNEGFTVPEIVISQNKFCENMCLVK